MRPGIEGSGEDGKPRADLIEEADRVIAAAQAAGAPIRLAGGLAIRRRHPSAQRPPLQRSYADLDLATTSKGGRRAVIELMTRLGYVPDQIFNGLHGQERLYFADVTNERHVDVFVDAVRMCHVIEFKHRFDQLDDTLTVSDLLLTKLQIVELNHKDMLDLLALLHDQRLEPGAPDAFDPEYLGRAWGRSWPIWRTSGLTLGKVRAQGPDILDPGTFSRVSAMLSALEEILVAGEKTLAWKLRARVGDRMRWYEIPEEVHG
jgi:hypothetical protein